MAHANVSSSSCGQPVKRGRDAVYSFFQLSSNRHSPPHPAAHRHTSTSLRCRFHQREPCFWGSCANARCIRSSRSRSDDLKLDALFVRIREKNHSVTSPSRHQISDERHVSFTLLHNYRRDYIWDWFKIRKEKKIWCSLVRSSLSPLKPNRRQIIKKRWYNNWYDMIYWCFFSFFWFDLFLLNGQHHLKKYYIYYTIIDTNIISFKK